MCVALIFAITKCTVYLCSPNGRPRSKFVKASPVLARQGGLKAKLKSCTYIESDQREQISGGTQLYKIKQSSKKLDQIYVKYLIPYDALTQKERQKLAEKMDERLSK